MRSPLSPVLPIAILGLSACSFQIDILPDYVGESSYQLAEFTEPDGLTEVYELRVEPTGQAYITISREEQRAYAELGLLVEEVNTGLLVRSVTQSSAARGKIAPDDIILSINGKAVKHLQTYNEILDELPVDQPVIVKLRGVETPRTLQPDRRSRSVRTRRRVNLETPKRCNPTAYAGIRVGIVPKEHSRKIYGDDRNAIVITGVVLGSPAYLAGLRAGDVIERIDGRRTPDLEGLLRVLREQGFAREMMEFEVVRDGGRSFVARVYLEDYSGVSHVRVPFVFHSRSSARHTSWEMIWGLFANYSNSYTASKTREPEENGSYSMLLGLIRFSWSPRGSRTRLLWFISFD